MYFHFQKRYVSASAGLLFLMLCCCFLTPVSVHAADASLSEEMLAAHSAHLSDITDSLELMTDQTEEMNLLLAEAQIHESRQYRLMKLRIQWLYETGYTSLLEQLLSASDFPDFLNRSELIHTLIKYDREQLKELSRLRSSIEEDAALLLQQCDLLRNSREILSLKYEELLSLLDGQSDSEIPSAVLETSSRISNLIARADSQIETGRQTAAQADTVLSPDHLDSDGLREPDLSVSLDGSDKETENLENSGTDTNITDTADGEDIEDESDEIAPPPFAPPPSFSVSASESLLLAALIQCEAGTEDYDAMTALTSCILNRVSSPLFPATIRGVIESEPLFSSVSDGKLDALLAGEVHPTCQSAVCDAISGVNPIGSCLYFSPSSQSVPGIRFGRFTFY